MVTLMCLLALGSSLGFGLQEASDAAHARSEGGAPRSWYAVQPVRVCLTSPPVGTPIFGGDFDAGRPYYLLGQTTTNQWLVWKQAYMYWKIPVESVSVRPVGQEVTHC
jgi:hypothetical protein